MLKQQTNTNHCTLTRSGHQVVLVELRRIIGSAEHVKHLLRHNRAARQVHRRQTHCGKRYVHKVNYYFQNMSKLLPGIFERICKISIPCDIFTSAKKKQPVLYQPTQQPNQYVPAPAARTWGMVPGNSPPPSCSMPPTMVIPEIALVMAIRGECSACDTPCGEEKGKV